MLDIYMKEDNTTRLKVLPVCDCGHVFTSGVVCCINRNEINGNKYPVYSIEPAICPNCKKLIECIVYDKDKITFVST